jgi:hypothetical protein
LGTGALSGPTGIVDWESCTAGHFKGHGLQEKNPPATDFPKQSPIQGLPRHCVAVALVAWIVAGIPLLVKCRFQQASMKKGVSLKGDESQTGATNRVELVLGGGGYGIVALQFGTGFMGTDVCGSLSAASPYT